MKPFLRVLILAVGLYSLPTLALKAQITTSAIRANFGIDGELRANFYNGFVQPGTDDWFNYPGTIGAGKGIIDTTGAAALVARYATDVNYRQLPFYRTMNVPAYSLVNNKLAIDAVFIRDYHGSDSTAFATSSNKNGDNPNSWSTQVTQNIPDKNDILDMMVHVRRAGPTITDSLWMFGGLSIQNTQGDRYFDFEMYQTDIYYDRPSLSFYGYGPDAGHTAWKMDASGNFTQVGDIVFSASYGSSTLSSIEARIWVDRATLSITPADFIWSGSFDGATPGSQFGYAGILPKNSAYFYTGFESPNNTWAGPFSLVLVDNSLATNYTSSQFMEFSVNLTALGLDPVNLLGGNACGMPFRRVLVKSRSSTSFTAELKDFVGPFDFFLAPRVQAAPTALIYCGVSSAVIKITNPSPTSVYNWTTSNGSILGGTTGDSIIAATQGTYFVTQQLQAGCSTYAIDTITLVPDPGCVVLANNLLDFHGNAQNRSVQLNWTVTENQDIRFFDVERSMDGDQFDFANRVYSHSGNMETADYASTDDLSEIKSDYVYYRLKITGAKGEVTYSKVINIPLKQTAYTQVSIGPNPATDLIQVHIYSATARNMQLNIYDLTGRLLRTLNTNVQEGYSSINLAGFRGWQKGIYVARVLLGNEIFTERILLANK
jgi:hypothetical protein